MFLPLPNGKQLLLVIQAYLLGSRMNIPWSLKPEGSYHTKTLSGAPDVSHFKLSSDN